MKKDQNPMKNNSDLNPKRSNIEQQSFAELLDVSDDKDKMNDPQKND